MNSPNRSLKKLKYVFSLVVMAAFAATAHSQKVDDAYTLKTFDISSPQLDISTAGGYINVIGHDKDNVRVEMYVRKSGKYLSASDTELEDYEIDISASGNEVTASAGRRNSSGIKFWNNSNSYSISFVVYTPERSMVTGRTSGGSMKAENISGTLDFTTSGGSISLSSISGDINARTSGGSLNFENLNGNVNGRTSGGSIRVLNAQGELDLRTSGGSVKLDEVAGIVNARTSGGSIQAISKSESCSLDLSTSGGNISITLPDNSGYELDLKGNRVSTTFTEFSGEVEKNRVIGTIRGGGPKIAARTSGGSVRLNYN